MGEWRFRFTNCVPRHYVEMNGKFHTLAALPCGKIRRLDGPQPVWTWWLRENFLHYPCRELNPGRPVRSVVAFSTELLRLEEPNGTLNPKLY
jgi:hypothetical protein